MKLMIPFFLFAAIMLAIAPSFAGAAKRPTGLELELDASHLASGPLKVWRDLSGRGNDVSQPDPAFQPLVRANELNGKPAVVFSGNQYLDGPAVLPAGVKSFTYVAVWKRDATGGSQSIVEQAAEGVGRRACLLTTDSAYGYNGEFNDQHGLMPYTPEKFVVTVLRMFDNGIVSVTQNGATRKGAINVRTRNIGAVQERVGGKIYGFERLKGAIAEIQIYDHALSDDQVRWISHQLSGKWGIHMISKDPVIASYEEMIRENERNKERYTETYRPQFHFTPISGWMNDPNGLCYFNGVWHMFYQTLYLINQQSWGHAVSRDLVHWTHLPPAILPDEMGAIWSGSAVVDSNDTSGLFHGKPGMVCIFTYMNPGEGGRQSQGMAYSPDGIHFTKYAHNPIIPQLRHQPGQPDDADFRDPKVFWYAPDKKWVMITGGGTVRFYSSPNLRDWKFESINEGINTECPDFFELPVDGDKSKRKWVLNGAGDWYILGDFNGKVFTPESDRIRINYGNDFYASQTWSNAPKGERIMIGWMYKWGYTGDLPAPLSNGGMMTIPVVLSLKTTSQGVRLFQTPIQALRELREKPFEMSNRTFGPNDPPSIDLQGKCLEIVAEFQNVDAKEFGIRVRTDSEGDQTTAGYDAKEGQVFVDRRKSGRTKINNFANIYKAPLQPKSGVIKMHIFVDWSSIELFCNDGERVITCDLLPPPEADGLELYSMGGKVKLVSLTIYPLKSIWRSDANR